MADNRLAVQATGTSPTWASLLEQVNVAAGFDLAVQPDPYQPTDVASFNQAGVPSLSFTTGAHTDYHKPSDTADKINYEDLERVARMAAAIVSRVSGTPQPPAFAKVEQSQQTANRTGLRVFTGTVPDYTSTAKGLLLGGVVGGGPADQAGLAEGRRHRGDCRAEHRQHLRLHLCPGAAEDRPAGQRDLRQERRAARRPP